MTCDFGEIAGLRWGAVDLRDGVVRVERTLVEDASDGRALGTPKTEAAIRTVPLSTIATNALRGRRAALAGLPHPDLLVFTDTKGSPIRRSNFHRRVWRPLLGRAGLGDRGIHFHDTRHAAASMLLAEGVDLATVAGLLGHADAKITLAIYAHTLPSAKRDTAAKMDALFGS